MFTVPVYGGSEQEVLSHMKILVFSDSHNCIAPMLKMVQATSPDIICHLGDHDTDALTLEAAYPHIPLYVISGNCDIDGLGGVVNSPNIDSFWGDVLTFKAEGKRIAMTHGDRYRVKSGLEKLIPIGRERGADILLFGHTHIPYYAQIGDMHVLNPGPASHSCALIEITDGEIICNHISI